MAEPRLRLSSINRIRRNKSESEHKSGASWGFQVLRSRNCQQQGGFTQLIAMHTVLRMTNRANGKQHFKFGKVTIYQLQPLITDLLKQLA